jgi:hypothetical protein
MKRVTGGVATMNTTNEAHCLKSGFQSSREPYRIEILKRSTMAKVIFGNHSSVLVPQQERDIIRKFYCEVLGGKIIKADPERDFVRLGENFYIAFLYADVPDEGEFLRSARSIWLELKSDNVEEMSRRIVESGLVMKLQVPDPHLYFQAPGGQCLRLVGINEDLSFYEGVGEGPNVAKVKQALRRMTI